MVDFKEWYKINNNLYFTFILPDSNTSGKIEKKKENMLWALIS